MTTTNINTAKFAEAVTKLASGTLTGAQKGGVLGNVVANLKSWTKTTDGLTKDELEDRLVAVEFAKPIFDQLKPEVVEQVNTFADAANLIINEDESAEGNDNDGPTDSETDEDEDVVDSNETDEAAPATPQPQPASRAVPVEKKEKKEKAVKEAKEPGKKGKKPDPNSGRQQILTVLKESAEPLTPKQIKELLTAKGIEVEYVSSHLNYFKSKNQVTHREDKRYEHPDNAGKVPNVSVVATAPVETVAAIEVEDKSADAVATEDTVAAGTPSTDEAEAATLTEEVSTEA
jgi:hypothetical protein